VISIGLLLLACVVGPAEAEEKEVKQKKSVPVLEIKETTYDFGRVIQGNTVKHVFQVFNRGDATLRIKNVKPG